MTTSQWLTVASSELESANIQTARLDAIILLSDLFSKDKAWVLAYPNTELSKAQITKLNYLLNRRAKNEPLAYIRGRCEFYSREFQVSAAVMQPRPESETIIEELKRLVKEGVVKPTKNDKVHITDVGCGSGALGITAALEIPNSTVELLEIDKKAAEVAKMNVDLFTIKARVVISDLLRNAREDIDVLLCNLPYVPDDYVINESARFEPRIALFGGPDGLNVYRSLFRQIQKRSQKPLLILIESFPFQQQKLCEIAQKSGYTRLQTNDFVEVYIKA
jgi:release factor glutamine methyltransferase